MALPATVTPAQPSQSPRATLRQLVEGAGSLSRLRVLMYLAFLALVVVSVLALALHGSLMLQLQPPWGTLALVLLLALLSLAVVEPTVRAVAQQAERQDSVDLETRRLAQVAQRTSALVLITDADDRIEWANAAFTQRTGWRLDEVKGLRPAELLHSPAADPAHGTLMQEAVRRGLGLRQQSLHRARDGATLWLDVDLRVLQGGDAVLSGFVRVASDITGQLALQHEGGAGASAGGDEHSDPPADGHTDALTRLPNRAAVLTRLQQAIAHAGRHPGYGFALLFLDFDRFKQVNDSLGHAAGDELLRQIAHRLQQALRPGDALARLEPGARAGREVAARLGGDEFVVVLDGVNSLARVTTIADRVLKDVSEPYLIGCTPLQSSASIGVVLHLGLGAEDTEGSQALPSAEDVLRNADIAMYEAKRAGRGRWVLFDNSMQERAARAMAVEIDLRRALQADELFVLYEPVVDLHSRVLTGVEAPVRWRHPERGLVGPADFMGVAEECGLIDDVGARVWHKACTQFVQWRALLGENAPPQLAVTVSRAQLKRAGFVQTLAATLAASGMQPQWLQLEITESLAAQDEAVQATLHSIKALGVKLALDHFGTGYSSLSCLHQLPVDTVKIDRSFVQHAQAVEYHRVLVEATIRVAQTLGMGTVAEGVETEDQAALMLSLHCGRGQGLLFGRPMEAAALECWVRAAALQDA